MAEKHIETIKCPECGKEFDFTVWDSINTVADKDMKDKLFSREIFKIKCPECDNESMAAYNFLYNDIENGLMIQYVPNQNETEKYIEAFDQVLGEGEEVYKCRIVNDMNSLFEKLMIHESGLDDRVIELMKSILVSQSQAEISKIGTLQQVLFGIKDGGDKAFILIFADGKMAGVDFSKDDYDKIAEGIKKAGVPENEYVIDPEWAFKYFTGGEDNDL